MRKGLEGRQRTGLPSRTTDQTRAYCQVCEEHSLQVVSMVFLCVKTTWSAGRVTQSKRSLKYSFCLWIVRLALRIGKPALKFGLALLFFGFVEHESALFLVFYSTSRESVRGGHWGHQSPRTSWETICAAKLWRNFIFPRDSQGGVATPFRSCSINVYTTHVGDAVRHV